MMNTMASNSSGHELLSALDCRPAAEPGRGCVAVGSSRDVPFSLDEGRHQQAERVLLGVIAALPQHLDVEAIARQAGLPTPPTPPLRPEACSEAAFHRLWEVIVKQAKDPTLPFDIGTLLPLGTYGIIDFLAGSSPNVGLGFLDLERYFGLVSTEFAWRCEFENPSPSVELVGGKAGSEQAGVFHQFIVGLTLARFKLLATAPLVFRSVGFAMPRPPDPSRHAAFFDCPVEYGCSTTRIELSEESWRTPMNRHEPGLRLVLEEYAGILLSVARPEDSLMPLRRLIRASLAGGNLSLELASRGLAMSTRTLQRRLRNAGTTFQDIVEEERAAVARVYLRDPKRSQAEVAELLGYSEYSAFTRAFRRWTGMTPSHYRAPHPIDCKD
jgi:AraC-like DNA-binding protein